MSKREARIRRGIKTKATIKNSNRPRLVVFRSLAHIYAQIIVRDVKGDKVILSDSEVKSKITGTKVEQAYEIGKLLGARAKTNSIEEVAFDRSGFKYHGRVKALADGAREAGLIF